MADGQYKFSIGLDSKQLELDVAQAKKAFDSLVKQAQQAGVKIDNIPNPFENIGKSAPQVAQATQQFNGLNVATQQLVRELPAASMGLNTFFLAISNNLPIFADQVKNLRQQGTSVAGVLKGIGTALFSWQTALVLGVTALSMYGKEIGKWVVSLFKGKEALDAMADAEKTLRDVRRQGIVDAQEEITKIRLTVQAAQNATASIEERTNALRALKSEYPDYFANLSDEQIMYGDVADSVQALIDKTIALAQARKAFNQIVENEENLRLLEQTRGYSEWAAANEAFEGVGRKYEIKQQVGGRASDYVWKDTREGLMYDQTQEQLLDNLEAMGEEGEQLIEIINDKYNGNVDAYIKAVAASNEELKESATALVTDNDSVALRAAEQSAKQIAEASARLRADAERATSQAEVDAMAEGIQKKIAQINLNYDLEEQAITKREEELKKLRGGMLTSGEQKAIDAMRKANASERDRSTQAVYNALFAEADAWLEENNSEVEEMGEVLNKELARRTKAWEDYFLKYGTIKERLLAVTTKYNRLIKDAETEAERMSLEAERDAILAQYEVETSAWAEDLVGKTREQLNTMIDELTAEVEAKEAAFDALDSSTGKDAANYRKEIAKLKAQIKELKAKTGEASDAISNDNWADAINLFQNIGNSATEAAEGISEFDENLGFALKGIAQLASLSVEMIGALQGVQKAFEKTGEAASAMEKASAILAIISVVIKVVSGIVSGISNIMNSNYEATRNATLAAYEYAQALEKIANVELRESFRSMFGVDEFGKFSALLTETQKQLENIDKIKSDYIARVTTTPFFATRDQKANAYVLVNNNGNPEVLYADMRSGWQSFWGTGKDNEIRANLSEFFEDGILNVDKLKAWYEQYGEYLSDAQSDLVESLIESGELYEENMGEINSYMQSIFGELGASVTDSLVDAFRNGTDAAEAMGNAVSNVLERIATDMAHAAFIQPLLEQAQDDIEALNKQRSEGGLSDEEYMRQLMGITSTLMGNAQDAGEGMAAYLDTMRQMAKEMGIDLFESDSAKNSTYAKGFQTMSQETGSELNGRFTDIQGQTHRIAEAVEFCRGLQAQQAQHLQSVSSTLASIHNDTSLIAEHTKALARMDANLDAMRRAIDNGAI